MGYQLRDRWLEWKDCFMPELESLKRQIDTIKRQIARAEDEPLLSESTAAMLGLPFEDDQAEQKQREVDDLREVLATLERLMPPF